MVTAVPPVTRWAVDAAEIGLDVDRLCVGVSDSGHAQSGWLGFSNIVCR